MPRVAAILGFSAVLSLCCGDLPRVSAQTTGQPEAVKFDEFGKLGHCDITARLDNLAIQLQNTLGAKAHLISYAPPGVGERLLELIKEYLVQARGLPSRRIQTTYGGRNTDLTQAKIELWIVPRNALPPAPQKLETVVDTFKGLFTDDGASDTIEISFEDAMGPGIGGTTQASFADVLNQQKNAVGYIVIYSGEDATPGAWRRIADEQLDYLKEFKVDSGRVKVIFGGHQKETRRQLWILPKDAPPPVPDAGRELPMAKAVKVQDFYAFDLGDKQNEARVFKRLGEILDAQKTVRAFLVVRLEPPTTQDGPIEAPSEETQEPADLTKLVEKWRVELANTHKIGPDRFIVVFTTSQESESSRLSLWIVPKGHPLPDPNEEKPEEDPMAINSHLDRVGTERGSVGSTLLRR